MRKALTALALTPAIVFSAEDIPVSVKLRIQPRLDFGDLYKIGNTYTSRTDFYLRRARLEVNKIWKEIPLGKSLRVNITFEMDKGEKDYSKSRISQHDFQVGVLYAYVNWKLSEEFNFLLGKKKKPFSRISLTSSSKQLLIERPFSTETAKKWLGNYYATQIMLYGKVKRGILRYAIALSDGSTVKKYNKTGFKVISSPNMGNLYAIRIEISPPGFIEKKKDDTGVKEKNTLSLGISYARLKGFNIDREGDGIYEIKGEKGTVKGADLFIRFKTHIGIITAQAEYVNMEYEKIKKREDGWYIQTGYKFLNFEPAVRYENHNKGEKKITTLGFNHYLKAHKAKWSYNFVLIKETKSLTLHQLQAQFYF